MKKVLLSLSIAFLASSYMYAQQRLALFEEFTGENCGPCAANNPGLWVKMMANTDKAQIIKYQVPIPTAGPIYNEYTAVASTRRSYYGVNSAPTLMIDGAESSPDSANPGHPYYLQQVEFDNAAAVPTPFAITITGKWSKNNDSLLTTVKVKAVSAYSSSTANLKLRVAFVQTLEFSTAPGSNGEKTFENVVRQMFPTTSGTSLNNTWASGEEKSFTLDAKLLSHVKTSDMGYWVAWIQNDADKKILQSARTLGNDFPTGVQTMSNNGLANAAVYPNPATDGATVRISLSESTKVGLKITDLSGRTVYTAPEQQLSSGTHEVYIPTSNLTTGLYLVVINSSIGSTVERLSVSK